MNRSLPLAATCAALLATPAFAALDTNRIEQITGLKGAWNAAEGAFKITAPRTDLPVTVDGWTMPPFMGLTTRAAFIEGKQAESLARSLRKALDAQKAVK